MWEVIALKGFARACGLVCERIAAWMSRQVRVFQVDVRGDLTSKTFGIIVAMFVCGVILPTSLVHLCNVSLYPGCPVAVTLMATVLLPTIGVIAVARVLLKG